jgi:hypothetical protein
MKKSPFSLPGVVIIIAMLAVGVFLWWAQAPNKTILVNASGAEVTDVCLSVWSVSGSKVLSKEAEVLDEGDSIVLRHSLNDSKVTVSFRLAGKEYKYDEPYVDLWTGEAWVLTVMPDGSVQSGYSTRTGNTAAAEQQVHTDAARTGPASPPAEPKK